MIPKHLKYPYTTFAGSLCTIVILTVMGIMNCTISQISELCGLLQEWALITGTTQIVSIILLSAFLIIYQCFKDERFYKIVQIFLGVISCVQLSILIFGAMLLFGSDFVCRTKLIWATSLGSFGAVLLLLISIFIYMIVDRKTGRT